MISPPPPLAQRAYAQLRSLPPGQARSVKALAAQMVPPVQVADLARALASLGTAAARVPQHGREPDHWRLA